MAQYGSTRAGLSDAAAAVTVGELLEDYLGSAQLWKPATLASHRHVISTLGYVPAKATAATCASA